MLSEIDRKPSDDKRFNREGYALAAGLSLGLVTLPPDTQSGDCSQLHSGLSDLRFVDGSHTMTL